MNKLKKMIKSKIKKGETEMTTEELLENLKNIQKMKCETQCLELKTAELDCPKRLYDTLSSFSNQDEGGIIIYEAYKKNIRMIFGSMKKQI